MADPLEFTADGQELRVCYSNRGDSFRDGVEFQFNHLEDYRIGVVCVLLEVEEVEELRDKLTEFLEQPTKKVKA